MYGKFQFPCGCSFPILEENTPEGCDPLCDIDIDNVPNCPATWELISSGRVKGVFQLETPLGKRWAKALKPNCLAHMGALGALLRPGPLRGCDEDGVSMTEHYVRRKNGLEPVSSFHPALDSILGPTYNVVAFQEQMMFIGRDIAGFTEVEVDTLRKSVGKKDQAALAKVRDNFLAKSKDKGIVTESEAKTIWSWIQAAGRYAFCKCVHKSTIIRRTANRFPGTDTFTVEEMYRIRHDRVYARITKHFQLHRKWQWLGHYGNGYSLQPDGRIRLNIIKDIQHSGTQPLYQVKLKNGATILTTANHSFPTTEGIRRVDELIGVCFLPKLYVCGPYERTKKRYNWSDYTNDDRAKKTGKSGGGTAGEQNRWFTNGSWSDYMELVATLPDVCERCEKTECDRYEHHHINGDRTNSKRENIQKLCVSCHKKAEYAAGRIRRGEKGYPALEVEIDSISYWGKDETYDVTMEAPNHTFVTANGILTCNSHADCYGIRGYKTAYIKTHFPLMFFTSWLKNAKHKSPPREEIYELVSDAKLFNIAVEPPDILSLEPEVHTDRKVVKFGIANIKGVGEAQVKKLQKATAGVETALGRKISSLSSYETLLYLADSVNSAVFSNLILAGALRFTGAGRQRFHAELKVWTELTAKEKSFIREGNFSGLSQALKALGQPRYRKPEPYRMPKEGDEEEALNLEAELVKLDEAGVSPKDPERSLKRKRYLKITRLIKPLEPIGPFGGCSSNAREEVVRSYAKLLDNPPSSLDDTPAWLARQEEQLLGIALSCSRADECDSTQANCTVKEFREGKKGNLYLCVFVESVEELKTKKGKNAGAKMGRVVISDGTASAEAVAFPAEWVEYAYLLAPGNTVLIQGQRDRKNEYESLTIQQVWQATASPPL